MNITYRRATIDDKEFIIDVIIASEKGEHDIISYCAIFDLTEKDFRDLLGNILNEQVEGQEICVSNFLIAEVDGELAATLGAFVENKDGLSSNFIKSNLLMSLLDREKIIRAAPKIKLMQEVDIEREPNTLQFEYGFIYEKYRGLGLFKALMEEHIKEHLKSGVLKNKLQLIILKDNIGAMKSHLKSGYKIVQERTCTDRGILKLMSCDTKVLMEKTI